jgi:hypothetical protein
LGTRFERGAVEKREGFAAEVERAADEDAVGGGASGGEGVGETGV